jgi:sulfur carrier protein
VKILVNGDSREIAASNLEAALNELGYRNCIVATAVNGEFVSVGARTAAALSEGDRLEVLAPMQGG